MKYIKVTLIESGNEVNTHYINSNYNTKFHVFQEVNTLF